MEKVYGINPIKILLCQPDSGLVKLYVSSGRDDSAAGEIVTVARQKNIPVEIKNRQELNKLTGNKIIKVLWGSVNRTPTAI